MALLDYFKMCISIDFYNNKFILIGAVCENFDIKGCIQKTYGDEGEEDDEDDKDDEDEQDEDEDEDEDDEEGEDEDDENDEDEDGDDEEGEDEEYSPYSSIDLDSLWMFIKNSYKMNSLMNASFTGGEDEDAETEYSSGLLSDHAYSVLQAVDVKLSKKHHVRLIKIRNPHGTEDSWTGMDKYQL